MQFDEIVAYVRQNGGPVDRDQAERTVVAVVEVLGQRLAAHEPSNLAAQLPAELKQPLIARTGEAERFDSAEFVNRVAQRVGIEGSAEDTKADTQVVFGALNNAVTAGELNDVFSQLPADYQQLVP